MEISQKTLGDIVKFAREKSGITIEALSERLDITERYLYRIENEGKIPSFKLLYKIIRELSIARIQFSTPKSRPKIPK